MTSFRIAAKKLGLRAEQFWTCCPSRAPSHRLVALDEPGPMLKGVWAVSTWITSGMCGPRNTPIFLLHTTLEIVSPALPGS